MITTSLATIIEHAIGVVEAIVPTGVPLNNVGFRLAREPSRPLRTWLPAGGENNRFRVFEIEPTDVREDIGILHTTANLVAMAFLLRVCYPAQPTLFGLTQKYELYGVIEDDARRIRDALFLPGGLAHSAHQANYVNIERLDLGYEKAWYQELTVTAVFYTAQGSS